MNLYRKYRSQKFADVIGQEHVVQVLSNALKNNNVSHAYLFSGPRGTGKTSVARLLAKSLNCLNRNKKSEVRSKDNKNTIGDKQYAISYEPCNECLSCREILTGSSMDVIEIDAASNRGIDEIRELRDKIKFAPSGKKFKVFIIDEVHMLTREAFNALLKTLEEPPAHAIFVLATTELHKVPDTIISRTQQFDFKRANMVNIISRLKHIAKLEKINIDEESLKLIARASEGSFRDAISLLDQVSGISKKITTAETRTVLGLSEWQTTIDFLQLIIAGKPKEIFDLVDKLYLEGIDFSQFCGDLIDLVRKMLLAKIGYKNALESFNNEQIKQLSEVTADWQMGDCMKYIRTFDRAKREMKFSSMVQLPLELASLELANKFQIPNNPSTSLRAGKSQINSNHQNSKSQTIKPKDYGLQTISVIPDRKSRSNASDQESSINIPKKFTPLRNEVSSAGLKSQEIKKDKTANKSLINLEQLENSWPEIISKLISKNHSLSILLKDSVPLLLTSDLLTIGIPFKFYKDRLEGKKIYADVCEIIQENLGIPGLKLSFKIDSSLITRQSKQTIGGATSGSNLQLSTINSQPSTKPQISNSNSSLVNDAMEVFGE